MTSVYLAFSFVSMKFAFLINASRNSLVSMFLFLCSCSNKYSKVHCQSTRYGVSSYLIGINVNGLRNVHSYQPLQNTGQDVVESLNATETEVPVNDQCGAKLKRKKLKGRRAVVKWLKRFRWKKKKEYERMTAEEKILFKLKKVLPFPLIFAALCIKASLFPISDNDSSCFSPVYI